MTGRNIPPGTPAFVQLVQVAPSEPGAPPTFEAVGALPAVPPGVPGTSGSPPLATALEGPTEIDGPLRVVVGANQTAEQFISAVGPDASVPFQYAGAIAYPYDPSQTAPTNARQLIRGTGGQLSSAVVPFNEGSATDDTGDRAGNDVRAFLYARNADNMDEAQSIVAKDGQLMVMSSGSGGGGGGSVAPNITTFADVPVGGLGITALLPENLLRTSVIIQNVGDAPFRIGGDSVAAGQGFQVNVGEKIELFTTAAINASIVTPGSPVAAILEFGTTPPTPPGNPTVNLTIATDGFGRSGFIDTVAATLGTADNTMPSPPGGPGSLQQFTQQSGNTWQVRFGPPVVAQNSWTSVQITSPAGTLTLNSADAAYQADFFGINSVWDFNITGALFTGQPDGTAATLEFS